MQYRLDKYKNELSILGFGCMRFKTNLGKINFEEAEKQIIKACELGINYFDTAYIYPGSEAVLGEILQRNNLRDKVNIATKLPHYLIKSKEAIEKIFNEELKRLRTDHIDYYLMHMLTDVDTWKKLISLGILEWIEEKKRNGQIRQIGFSYHGNTDAFCKLIDAYEWDFCMIQYNYMDEHSQAGVKGLKYANSKGLPVFIMEPLRGGRLAKLPDTAKSILYKHNSKLTPVMWALKWLWNQREVTVVLSGMNTIENIIENANTADSSYVGEFTQNEFDALDLALKDINSKMKIGCTGCGYCVPCPFNVDIPGTFASYNRVYSEGKLRALIDYFMCTALRKNPTSASNCKGCRKCEKHCPQKIEISKELKNATKILEGPLYKIGKRIASFFTF